MPNPTHAPSRDDTQRPALPAGRFAFTRPEDEDPLRPASREHDANGHYAIGPRLAKPPLVRMIADAVLPVAIAPRTKAPAAERRKKGREATRAERMRRLLAGQFAPVRKPRAA